ncbi:hypothetical protein NBRC10512_002587, partial [Rhodotorula toruloides]
MKLPATFYAVLIASGIVHVLADAAPPPYADWGQSDLKRYLQDHHIPNPGNLNTEQLRELAARHYDQQASNVKRGAQHVLQDARDGAYDTWSDSQLRQFLLDKGVISPSFKREELVQLAREYGLEASKTAESAWARTTDAAADAAHAVAENTSAAFYAVVDGPAQAYDYVAGKLEDTRDYVYSTWTDSDLHSWAVSKGLVKPEEKKRRDELLDLVRKPYSDATSHVYEAWSDSYLRNWLQRHGVVKSKTANTRDELLDLMSKNYYGARDTTYEYWSDSAVRRWLESRGLVKPNETKTASELRNLIASNYWKLRDQAYSAWDESMLRAYLDKNKVQYEKDAMRNDLVRLVKEY